MSGVSVVAIPKSSEVSGRIRGVMIFDIQKNSKAWTAGLRKDDIISSVNRRDVRNVEQFLMLLITQKKRFFSEFFETVIVLSLWFNRNLLIKKFFKQ